MKRKTKRNMPDQDINHISLRTSADSKADMGKRVTELHHLLAGGIRVPREPRGHAGAGDPRIKLSLPREASPESREGRQLQGLLLAADRSGHHAVTRALPYAQLQYDDATDLPIGLPAHRGCDCEPGAEQLSLRLPTGRSRFRQLLQ